MDKAEVKIPPKLTIQIWDNDKFSFDDYLGVCVRETERDSVCVRERYIARELQFPSLPPRSSPRFSRDGSQQHAPPSQVSREVWAAAAVSVPGAGVSVQAEDHAGLVALCG